MKKYLVFIFLLFSFQNYLLADEIAMSTFVLGKVYLIHDNKIKPLKIHEQIDKNDTVFTDKGKVEIQLGKNAIIRLNENSKISIKEFYETGKISIISLESIEGKVFSKLIHPLNKKSSFDIHSPTHVAGVRGTEFIFSVSKTKYTDKDIPEGVFINEGKVEIINKDSQQSETAIAGEQVLFLGGEMKKEILANFMKEKMEIFKSLQVMKEENYNVLKNQILRNKEELKKIRK